MRRTFFITTVTIYFYYQYIFYCWFKPFWEVIPLVIANNQAWTESVFAVPKVLKVLFLSIPRHYSFIITRTPKSKANYDDPDDAISRLLVAFGTANRNLPYWGGGNALKKINSLLTPPPRGNEGCLYNIEPLEESYLSASLVFTSFAKNCRPWLVVWESSTSWQPSCCRVKFWASLLWEGKWCSLRMWRPSEEQQPGITLRWTSSTAATPPRASLSWVSPAISSDIRWEVFSRAWNISWL